MTSVEIRIYITVSCTGAIQGTINIVALKYIQYAHVGYTQSMYVYVHNYVYLLLGCIHAEGGFKTELNTMLQYAPLL